MRTVVVNGWCGAGRDISVVLAVLAVLPSDHARSVPLRKGLSP